MQITEVRVKLMEDSDDRLRAFCSITFDDSFVIRDLKIIEGTNGPFVAMPSRKLTSHCPGCGCKNHLRAAYCNSCGLRLKDDRAIRDQEGRAKLYADIAHPINSACREMIQDRVIQEFEEEQQRANEPGYVSRYDDDFDLDYEFVDNSDDSSGEKDANEDSEAGEENATDDSHRSPAADAVVDEPTPGEDARRGGDGSSGGDSHGNSNGNGSGGGGAEAAPHDDRQLHADAAEPNPQGPHKSREARSSESEDDFGAGIF